MANKNLALRELFDKFIRHRTMSGDGLRDATIRSYKESFRLFEKLTPDTVHYPRNLHQDVMVEFAYALNSRERTVGKKIVTGVTKNTIATHCRRLMVFFRWLQDHEYLSGDSKVLKYKPIREDYSDDRSLRKSEIDKILSAITRHEGEVDLLITKRNKAIVYLLLYLGIRRGELIGLRDRDIDFDAHTVFIRAETSKSKNPRTLAMHADLRPVLKDYLQQKRISKRKCGQLIVSNQYDKPLTIHGLKHLVNRLRKISGVRFHLHQFRHTFAVIMARSNSSLLGIQKALGHADPRMTKKYLRSLKADDFLDEIKCFDIDRIRK